MGAGAKIHYLEFRTKTSTRSDIGESIEAWTTVAFTAWAEAASFGSREFRAIDRIHSESTIRFRLYYQTDPDDDTELKPSKFRIYYRGQYWKMQPPLPDNRSAEMTIEASVIE